MATMAVEASVSFFIAVFIFGITPGPGVFAIVAKALLLGPRSCMMLSLGMTISDMLYLIAACLGLAAIASNWGEVFLVVRILGAVYLMYLGWKMWTAPINLDPITTIQNNSNALMDFSQGFMISASNPKVILFYIAFLPTFIDLTVLGAADIAWVSFLTLISLMLGLSAIAWFAGTARTFFENEKGAKGLNRSAGAIMMLAGVFLLLKH